MSGHSKWANIKHRKGAQDAKRAKVFTRLLRTIQLAVREGGSDPQMNASLAVAIERAKSFNVPKDTIERALTKNEEETLEELVLEAIGPGGAQLIIECATNNKNRTLPDIRSLVEKCGGKLVQSGAAQWVFARKGFVIVERDQEQDADAAMLTLIDAGAEDVREDEGVLIAVTQVKNLAALARAARDHDFVVADATLGWDVKQPAELTESDHEKLAALVEALEEHEDVQSVWTNVD